MLTFLCAEATDFCIRHESYTTWFHILFGHLASYDVIEFGADEDDPERSAPLGVNALRTHIND